MSFMLYLLLIAPNTQPAQDLAAIFTDGDRAAFAELLSSRIRVRADLRPVLNDHGRLSRSQTLMAFDKLRRRYEFVDVRIANSQSDANYAWLERTLEVTLRHRDSGELRHATFAFHFKIAASQMAVHRWVLQDIY